MNLKYLHLAGVGVWAEIPNHCQVLSPHRELLGAISSDSQSGCLHVFAFL